MAYPLKWLACRIGLHPNPEDGWQVCARCGRRYYQPSWYHDYYDYK